MNLIKNIRLIDITGEVKDYGSPATLILSRVTLTGELKPVQAVKLQKLVQDDLGREEWVDIEVVYDEN